MTDLGETRDEGTADLSSDGDREIVARLQALPREIAPTSDLWPEIAARIRTPSRATSRPSPSRQWLALAAMLLLGILSTLGVVRWRSQRGGPLGAGSSVAVPSLQPAIPASSSGITLAAYAETDRTLAAIRDELRRAIDERKDKLPSATRALVFENLRTIDRAIAEIETALAAAPADPELSRTYITYRQRQIDLLRQANRMAARL
ncbi:MAG: hypothetical protein ABI639_01880 [Thermoanaerobaculia bacterium]